MDSFYFKQSPHYKETITRARAVPWQSDEIPAQIFAPVCFFDSIRDGDWYLFRNAYPLTLFELMLDGELEYQVDDESFVSKAGNLFITPPGHRVTVRSTKQAHCHRIGLEFSGRILPALLLRELRLVLPENIELSNPDKIEKLMRKICSIMGKKEETALPELLGLCWSFFSMLSLENKKSAGQEIPERLRKLLNIIRTQPERILRFNEMKSIAGMDAGSLQRFFHEHYNLPPCAYVNRNRMEHALILLRRGSSVKETADRLGFKNQFYFSRSFAHTFGFPPSSFRQTENQK